MKEIKLTQGQVALVDDEDFEFLSQWNWAAFKHRNDYYAIRKKAPRLMHRLIMKAEPGLQIDHIDHNGLNNQKVNLRRCNNSQNHMNMKPLSKTTKYKGIEYRKTKTPYYKAYISPDGKKIDLGRFSNEIDAARAYDEAAKKYYGEFAYLNF